MINVFVYGTLKDPDTVRMVLGNSKGTEKVIEERVATTLNDYKKVGLNIVPSTGSVVEGFLLFIKNPQLDKLDFYEGWPDLYRRLNVTTEDGDAVAYMLTRSL